MDTCDFPGFLSIKGSVAAKAQLVVLLCNIETRNAWADRLRGTLSFKERVVAQNLSDQATEYIDAQSERLLSYV